MTFWLCVTLIRSTRILRSNVTHNQNSTCVRCFGVGVAAFWPRGPCPHLLQWGTDPTYSTVWVLSCGVWPIMPWDMDTRVNENPGLRYVSWSCKYLRCFVVSRRFYQGLMYMHVIWCYNVAFIPVEYRIYGVRYRGHPSVVDCTWSLSRFCPRQEQKDAKSQKLS